MVLREKGRYVPYDEVEQVGILAQEISCWLFALGDQPGKMHMQVLVEINPLEDDNNEIKKCKYAGHG